MLVIWLPWSVFKIAGAAIAFTGPDVVSPIPLVTASRIRRRLG